MAGGFGLCGVPEDLINATREKGVRNLTVISNNAGIDGLGVGLLLETRQIRKFNLVMATAARVTIAEVEHFVEVGALDADCIHTPSIYVQRIFQTTPSEKRIERRTVRKRGAE